MPETGLSHKVELKIHATKLSALCLIERACVVLSARQLSQPAPFFPTSPLPAPQRQKNSDGIYRFIQQQRAGTNSDKGYNKLHLTNARHTTDVMPFVPKEKTKQLAKHSDIQKPQPGRQPGLERNQENILQHQPPSCH